MRYCSHCGAQIDDEAVVCVKCGCAVQSVSSQKSNKGKIIAIHVFLILSCVFASFGNYYINVNGQNLLEGIGRILSIATLAWKLPMTVIALIRLNKGKNLPMAFKVCTLIFVSLIAGILMLCLAENQQPMQPSTTNNTPSAPTTNESINTDKSDSI